MELESLKRLNEEDKGLDEEQLLLRRRLLMEVEFKGDEDNNN